MQIFEDGYDSQLVGYLLLGWQWNAGKEIEEVKRHKLSAGDGDRVLLWKNWLHQR